MSFYSVSKHIEIRLLGNIRVFDMTKVEEISLNGYFDTTNNTTSHILSSTFQG